MQNWRAARSRKDVPMSTWKPAPEAAAAAFTNAIAGLEGVEPRKMFGYSCAFANGHMLAGLHELGMIIRLPEGERGQFIQQFGARLFEPMPGRVMREYVVAFQPHCSQRPMSFAHGSTNPCAMSIRCRQRANAAQAAVKRPPAV